MSKMAGYFCRKGTRLTYIADKWHGGLHLLQFITDWKSQKEKKIRSMVVGQL